MTDIDVLIVGAGPAGLTMACDLRRRGVACRIVDTNLAPFRGSKGKGIQPRTQEILEDLGALGALLSVAGPYPTVRVHHPDGRTEDRAFAERIEPTAAIPYPNLVLSPQWWTEEVLVRRLAELGGTVERGTTLQGLEQHRDHVLVQLDGVRGPETIEARYLVAADGGRSRVRKTLGVRFDGHAPASPKILFGDVDAPGTDPGVWHQWPVEGGVAGLCPLPGGGQFQLMLPLLKDDVVELSEAGVSRLFRTRVGAGVEVCSPTWLSLYKPQLRVASHFRVGRTFLVGDAAHVHPPMGGQGLNTSVQDAYNLGWKLGAVLAGSAAEALLDTYEAERRPVAAEMLGLSTRVHRGEVRRGRATQQLGLGYRGSPLAVETRPDLAEEALHAGDRAPDGHRDGIRLFDAFRGPHWTLLTVGPQADPLPDLGLPVVRLAEYAAYGPGVFLVRPDGYVGWAGATPEGLAGYAAASGALPPAGVSARR